ncbi:MAG: glycosyltransferase family 2 protein [Planctomycetes bacterium]|nr:glycosyltransferase family 2 protein [Planctomycetota bacterium]
MVQWDSISACMIVRDEEKRLPGCLDSLRSVVDEIIVVDTGSEDRTMAVAEAKGAKVFAQPWKDDFSAARNAALGKATGNWILVLDADERLEKIGYQAFRAPLQDPNKLGFLLTLTNLSEQGSSSVQLLRLFRNMEALRFSGVIHERIDPALQRIAPDAGLALGVHPARIVHQGYLETVRREKEKDDRDLRMLRKQLALDPTDSFYWYKFAAHPFVRTNLKDEMTQAVNRAWSLVQAQDPEGKKFSYSAEVAALYLLDAFVRRRYETLCPVMRRAGRFAIISPNLHYTLGIANLVTLDFERASNHFENALASQGRALPYAPFNGVTSHLSLHGLSEVRYLQGREKESKEFFGKAVAFENAVPANSFHGDPHLLVKSGEAAWAIDLLTRAVQVRTSDSRLWHRGGMLLEALGLEDQARKWLVRAEACASC